jgi:hypothetical protein
MKNRQKKASNLHLLATKKVNYLISSYLLIISYFYQLTSVSGVI